MEVFDNELHEHYEDQNNTNNCLECEQPISQEKDFCSEQCYNNSDL